MHTTAKLPPATYTREVCRPMAASRSRCRCKLTAQATKRDALLAVTAWPAQLIASNIFSTIIHTPGAAAAVTDITSSATATRDPMFYAKWSYASPADIIPFIKHQTAPGDSQAVLEAMNVFGEYYPQYKIGPEKGAILEQVLQPLKPTLALEVGTFLGYSAIRTARQLAPGGVLVCIEANPENAAVARELVQYAGVEASVVILEGARDVIPRLPDLVSQRQKQRPGGWQEIEQQQSVQQQQQQLSFDLVFLDHCKDCYLPDLQALERLGFVHKGSTVLADNVLYPGAPGFLEYLDSSGRYGTELLRARYEYDQAWNPDWEPNKQDAISKSVWL